MMQPKAKKVLASKRRRTVTGEVSVDPTTEEASPGTTTSSQSTALGVVAARASSSRRSSNDNKIPLSLQLVIPFLKVGDLQPVAASSRACRKAALASYQDRLETPMKILPPQPTSHDPATSTTTTSSSPTTIKPQQQFNDHVPSCFHERNLWNQTECGLLEEQSWYDLGDAKVTGSIARVSWCFQNQELQEDRCWKFKWRSGPLLLESWQTGFLHIPEGFAPLRDEIADCQLCAASTARGQSSLVVTVRKEIISEGQEAADATSGTELWGLLYELPQRTTNDNLNDDTATVKDKSNKQKSKIQPVIVQSLLDQAKTVEWTGDGHFLGQISRSGNGKVVAVVTSMISPEYDFEDMFANEDDEFGGQKTAQVTIYDIVTTRENEEDEAVPLTGFVQRCVAKATGNGDVDNTIFQMSLSTCGEMLSILNIEATPDSGGSWRVYDIRTGVDDSSSRSTNSSNNNNDDDDDDSNCCKQILKLQNIIRDDENIDISIDHGIDIHFTPDNDLCVRLNARQHPIRHCMEAFLSKIQQTQDPFDLSKHLVIAIDNTTNTDDATTSQDGNGSGDS